jgi:hypothetical protein
MNDSPQGSDSQIFWAISYFPAAERIRYVCERDVNGKGKNLPEKPGDKK